MFKYLATATVGALVLAVALKARHAGSGAGGAPEALTITNQQPEVKVVAVPGGKDLTVRHRLLGAISRASLVYDDAKGEPRTVAQRTDCQQSLARAGGLREQGPETEVTLRGTVPTGAVHVRLVLEDETGTRIVPVDTN